MTLNFRLVLGIACLVAGAAHAQGFVDERSKAKPAEVAAAAPAATAASAAAPSAAPASPAAATPAPTAVATQAQAPEVPKTIKHELRTGEPIHTELKRWAEFYGWDFHWYHTKSWKTMRDTVIAKTSVDDAIAEVIDILRSEGKPVQLRISEGNRVLEVLSTEVRND